MRGQPRRSVVAVLYEGADDEAVVVVERVRGVVGVHLLLIIAPAMIADFVAKVV